MNALLDHLKRRIAREGALDIATYMAEALGHPEHGYYRHATPIGRSGDFTTAPEISQMFGELLGLWCVETWTRMGAPAPFVLAEFGPGRGTLMADALRAARVRPAFLDAMRLHLIETSAPLRAAQAERLAAHHPHWHDTAATLPDGPLIALGNEFLDALPIRQFERTGEGWRERGVAWHDASQRLVFTRLPHGPDARAATHLPTAAPMGAIAEVPVAALELVVSLARRLTATGGAALFIDYGHALASDAAREWSGSLQAVMRHGPADALADPGAHDLSAHVDFFALALAARTAGATVHGPVNQGPFLEALGIHARADTLMAKADPKGRAAIAVTFHRLVAASAMGGLFKAMAIAHPALGVMPEFHGSAQSGPLPGAPRDD